MTKPVHFAEPAPSHRMAAGRSGSWPGPRTHPSAQRRGSLATETTCGNGPRAPPLRRWCGCISSSTPGYPGQWSTAPDGVCLRAADLSFEHRPSVHPPRGGGVRERLDADSLFTHVVYAMDLSIVGQTGADEIGVWMCTTGEKQQQQRCSPRQQLQLCLRKRSLRFRFPAQPTEHGGGNEG